MLSQQLPAEQPRKLVPQHFPSTHVRPLPQQSLSLAHEPPTGVQHRGGSDPTVRQMRFVQQLPDERHPVPMAPHCTGASSTGLDRSETASVPPDASFGGFATSEVVAPSFVLDASTATTPASPGRATDGSGFAILHIEASERPETPMSLAM